MSLLRRVRAVHAVAVDLAGTHARHVAVPDLVAVFGQLDALGLGLAAVIEQAELDLGGVRREEGEVDPLPSQLAPRG